MATSEDVERHLATEHGLAVISTTQASGRVLSSVANCGMVDHPSPASVASPWSRPGVQPASATSVGVQR